MPNRRSFVQPLRLVIICRAECAGLLFSFTRNAIRCNMAVVNTRRAAFITPRKYYCLASTPTRIIIVILEGFFHYYPIVAIIIFLSNNKFKTKQVVCCRGELRCTAAPSKSLIKRSSLLSRVIGKCLHVTLPLRH